MVIGYIPRSSANGITEIDFAYNILVEDFQKLPILTDRFNEVVLNVEMWAQSTRSSFSQRL